MKARLHPERLVDEPEDLFELVVEEAEPRGARELNLAAKAEVER
jgi:hypothetical protein